MKSVLWLDDLRDPKCFLKEYDSYDVVWIKDYRSFVEYIGNGQLPDVVDFDHDLGEGESGYDCVKFLVNWCIDHGAGLPEIEIHTSNPVGRDNIKSIVDSFRKIYG